MARAKRTERADARRRYRQTIGAEEFAPDDELDAESDAAGATTPAGPRRAPVPGQRMGFADAMRAAYHRPDIRGDLAALPWLLRTRAFLIPLALVVGGIAAILVAPTNAIATFFFQLVVLPPAMAPVFIAGFFAKRASYLLGLIIAVIDVIGYTAFVYGVLPTLSSTPVTAAEQQGLVLSAVSAGPLSGLFFAASAAWYRRFLALTGGRRATRKPASGRAKSGRPARG